MFSLISANWAGEPLVDYHTLLNFVRDTTSPLASFVKHS